MLVFARLALADLELPAGRPALLLEGHWPAEAAGPQRWSLDEAIDARQGWIEKWAAEQAEALGRAESGQRFFPSPDAGATSSVNIAYLNALGLRYYLVRLLRVVAFFSETVVANVEESIELHATRGRDDDYADLLGQIALARGAMFQVHWREAGRQSPPQRTRARPWRRWAAQADDLLQPSLSAGSRPRVVLCGNPRILDPVCQSLLDRGCQVWWLYEHFAVRSWWKWRRKGVRQMVCDRQIGRTERFNDGGGVGALIMGAIDLSPVVERWLARQAAQAGDRQSRLVAQIDEHFRAIEPTALVLDEDATPLKRAATALARQHGARSVVVQHGAPCGQFGFAPLSADHFCAWGASSREQLLAWGVPPERVHETGWPRLEQRLTPWRAKVASRRTADSPRILLLATMPPKDHRPDGPIFHLTRHTHDRMLDIAFSVVARLPGAKLVVKLHPRCGDASAFQLAAERHPALRIELVRAADLAKLVAASDCVLSCASTSGIEAALMGAPVVQLLSAGSGDLLPAGRWGMLGSARDEQELETLVIAALKRGWQAPAHVDQVLGNPCRAAAEKVADVVLQPELTASAVAEGCNAADAADR